MHRLFGKWHESIYYGGPSSSTCVWRASQYQGHQPQGMVGAWPEELEGRASAVGISGHGVSRLLPTASELSVPLSFTGSGLTHSHAHHQHLCRSGRPWVLSQNEAIANAWPPSSISTQPPVPVPGHRRDISQGQEGFFSRTREKCYRKSRVTWGFYRSQGFPQTHPAPQPLWPSLPSHKDAEPGSSCGRTTREARPP